MARSEVRVSITAATATETGQVAAEFGVAPLVVTSWMMLLELDGEDSGEHLARAQMVNMLTRSGYHNPTIRRAPFNDVRYTEIAVPVPTPNIWCPPYPGKDTWTFVRHQPAETTGRTILEIEPDRKDQT